MCPELDSRQAAAASVSGNVFDTPVRRLPASSSSANRVRFSAVAFICIIVGGVGNVRGAFIGAMLVGLVDAGGNTLVPDYPGLLIFFAMIVFLLFRPQGLFPGGRT